MKKPIILLALVALLGSCKKDSSSNNAATAGQTTLMSGTWKISASTAIMEFPAPIGIQNVDVLETLADCQADNIYTFNPNNSVGVDEGATKCSPSDPQTKTEGSWSLTNNDTKLTSGAQGLNITADVLTLNNTTLKIKYVTNINNIPATTTTTYARP